jgi:hypothetical protein
MNPRIRAVDRHPSPECRELGTRNLVCLALTRRGFLIAEDYFSFRTYAIFTFEPPSVGAQGLAPLPGVAFVRKSYLYFFTINTGFCQLNVL